jgi:hypothetical protein
MIWKYRISWEQNMGNGRGINIRMEGDDWESVRLVWTEMCKDEPETKVRGVRLECDSGKGFVAFDPRGTWPRPPSIAP